MTHGMGEHDTVMPIVVWPCGSPGPALDSQAMIVRDLLNTGKYEGPQGRLSLTRYLLQWETGHYGHGTLTQK